MLPSVDKKLPLIYCPELEDCAEKINSWLNEESISFKDKQEILELLEQNQIKEVRDRFYQKLEFGTGGMRGIMAMGLNRMNLYVLKQAIQGIAHFILKQGEDAQKRGVVIAYDSRNHSKLFCQEAISVLAANKIQSFFYPTVQTTPALSFAIRHLHCIAGLCITASHNPPEYNGLKVYWQDGAQIVPPQDQEILNEVFALKSFSEIKSLPFEQAKKKGLAQEVPTHITTLYFEEIKKLQLTPTTTQNLKIVYTPLHGTGKEPALRALQSWGFQDVFVVPEQAEPDGRFPTVQKPNPEEKEALTLALQYASKMQTDCVFATDPDSDRLAIAAYEPQMATTLFKHQASGNYVLLNGNQTGVLLTDFILHSMQNQGKLKNSHKIIKTLVTTDFLHTICNSYKIELFNTLTGFKWIAAMIRSWEEQKKNNHYLFGLEESFGYMPAHGVRDKDAIASLCLAAQMLAHFKEKGQTPCQALLNLFIKHRCAWQEDLINIELYGEEGQKRIKRILQAFRTHPPTKWCAKLLRISQFYDLTDANTQKILNIPPCDLLQFLLEGGSKISMRPSGTEPKLKLYISVCNTPKDSVTPCDFSLYEQAWKQLKLIRKELIDFIEKIP
jgi:phosphoglucomutase